MARVDDWLVETNVGLAFTPEGEFLDEPPDPPDEILPIDNQLGDRDLLYDDTQQRCNKVREILRKSLFHLHAKSSNPFLIGNIRYVENVQANPPRQQQSGNISDFVYVYIEPEIENYSNMPLPPVVHILRLFRHVLRNNSSQLGISPESLDIFEQFGKTPAQLVFSFENNVVVSIRPVPGQRVTSTNNNWLGAGGDVLEPLSMRNRMEPYK